MGSKTVRRGRRLRGAVAALLLVATASLAALVLILDVTSASPGTIVHGHTPGTGDVSLAHGQRLPAFFAKATVAGSISSPGDPRLTPVGSLNVDAAGNGSIVLTVPSVPAGDYSVLVLCRACGPHSAGQVILPLADFQVITTPPPTTTETGAAMDRAGTYVAALFAAAAMLASWLLFRRGRT